MTTRTSTFTYQPSNTVPFRDIDAINRCRQITRDDIDKHPNPDFKITVMEDIDVEPYFVADLFSLISKTREENRKCVLLLPNPCPTYRHVAHLINQNQINCDHVWMFALDEYADQDGNIAPSNWEFGFVNSLRSFFWQNIDEHLRPPLEQLIGPNNTNIDHYLDLMMDLGGIDKSYSGPGWTGHMAFIEPDAPEFDLPLEDWKEASTRIVTLSPYTIAQNSLHGCFGASGDLAAVPPKAVTIGPKEILTAKARMEIAALGVHGTWTSWQRLIARLCYHGPITPKLPSSILQTVPTEVIISETVAQNIEPTWDKGY
ncbi:hypothetical protein [Poriferisphaera sp. WC338]|uniref:hypothetical protein n=1 Tax=Poriferisphaera sp. WC338 TaxID=3425129 RepID=UPI003D81623A